VVFGRPQSGLPIFLSLTFSAGRLDCSFLSVRTSGWHGRLRSLQVFARIRSSLDRLLACEPWLFGMDWRFLMFHADKFPTRVNPSPAS
jgi:hypothetical protein